MELWDAYDSDFHRIEGMVLTRGEPVKEGLFHLVCDVLVKHTDGTYLLMKRSAGKHFGGMWEASAGGSALQGETPWECARRELWEETGIEADEFTELGRVVNDRNHSVYVEFLCVTDWKKDRIVLQEGETSDYRWVSKDELMSMTGQELVTRRILKFIEIY